MNKRQKYTTILLTGTAVFSTLSVSLPYHFSNSKTRSSLFFTKNSDQPLLINKENLDLNKAYDSSSDFNIHDKPKESKPEPKPEPIPPVKVPPIVKPKPIETPKPQPKPQAKPIVIPIETPKPQPKPQAKPIVIPIETPKPQPKPEPKPETRIKSDVIKTDVGEISVVYEEQPPRKENRDDVAAGITNRVKYIAQLTPNILSVAPSAENIKESIANSVQNLNRFQNTFFGKSGIVTQFYKDHYAVAGHDELQDYLDRSPMDLNVILKLFDKYRALIEAGNAKPFLLDEFQDKYEEWFNNTKTFEYIPPVRGYGKEYLKVGHLWIAMHIDPNKFTELSDTLKKDLDKGFYIDKDNDNIYVDKNGKLNSYAVSPIFNAVVSEITRNNLEKRVFGSNSKWNRPADSIDLGNYPGWTKTDVTSTQEFAKYNVGYSDGIKIEKLTKEKDNPSKTQDGFLITIDVANKSGYEKSINFIKSLQDDNKTITGYRIKNIGRSGASQELKDVLAQLPKKLPLLELFFESFNTSSLIALEEKEIDELGLYTSQNSLVDEWSLNPWSLKGVAYVNMADYNVSASYNKYDRIFTRITFNSIGFDDKDWVSETDLTRINNGLRMVYFTRNNERIFQGGFGPGLNPDHNEGGNSYPTGLDLSRVTKAKGLKNMEFWDRTKGKGVNLRKLKRIVLYNESEIWETDTDNMNKAQFNYVLDKFVAPGVPKSKIIFSNRKNTKNIKITPKIKGHKLDNEGIANLSTLFNFSDGTFSQSNTIIYVPEGESQLYNQLKGLGYNTQYQAEGEEPIQLA